MYGGRISYRHGVLPLLCIVVLVCASPPSAPHITRGEQLKDFPKAILTERDPILVSSGRAVSAHISLKWDYHQKFPALLEEWTVLKQVMWVIPS